MREFVSKPTVPKKGQSRTIVEFGLESFILERNLITWCANFEEQLSGITQGAEATPGLVAG